MFRRTGRQWPSLKACGAVAGVVLGTFLSPSADAGTVPPIRHVFVVVLENEGYKFTFGENSPAPYLSRDLVARGALLTQYYGIGHVSLDNYIAMISGQSPNYETQSDCQTFSDFTGTQTTPDGQAVGHGCVYPRNILTLADELQQDGLTWKSYSEDMGNDPAREAAACGHAALGTHDQTQQAQPARGSQLLDQYAARHNPFVYFHSIIDSPVCAQNVVGLQSLHDDLRRVETTANFIFITPNLCNDGHDGGSPGRTCVNGEPGGLVSADRFLRLWVPRILASPAFRKDGLLVITFDEADVDIHYDATTHSVVASPENASACCNEPAGPNTGGGQSVFGMPDKGPGIFGPGGGLIGAVLLSPFIKPGTVSHVPYNHYSLLKSISQIFAVPALGYAAQPDLAAFGTDIYSTSDER